MSVNPQEVPVQNQETQKSNDKEYNFAQVRQQLEREKQEKLQLKEEVEKLKQLAQQHFAPKDEEDDASDDEPYVDHKRLKKELVKVVKQAKTESQTDIQTAVNRALSEERQKQWMKANPDFYDIMQHAQAFADRDPELAETILEMPEGFERNKLVYKNIKALGIHKPPEAKSNIQDKIDQNRKSPYYQPSGVGAAPYAAAGDFSPAGQKSAFAKMQELKERLRM